MEDTDAKKKKKKQKNILGPLILNHFYQAAGFVKWFRFIYTTADNRSEIGEGFVDFPFFIWVTYSLRGENFNLLNC